MSNCGPEAVLTNNLHRQWLKRPETPTRFTSLGFPGVQLQDRCTWISVWRTPELLQNAKNSNPASTLENAPDD